MIRIQSHRPHHTLSVDGTAPWPVHGADGHQANPEDRCCRECGRRLLYLFVRSSTWVSHRTEHVSFRDDRAVIRRVTAEFYVPDEAPIFRGDDGRAYRLVPLSVMRRKTLVNFNLSDEEGKSVVLLSLRQNQAITESMLLACADAALENTNGAAGPITGSRQHIGSFIHDVVSGEQQILTAAYKSLDDGAAAPAVLELTKHRMFRTILDRLADNFVLWVMIPAGAPRRRVLTFSCDEPLTLRYRKPGLKDGQWELGPKLRPLTRTVLFSALGLTATRIRFPVPAAENTASFHFEIDAPPGIQIVEASLLAGRPQDEEPPSLDHVKGGFPTVGLHVIEVPNGSLSRVQIGLQVVTRGWLMTSTVSSWAVFGLLLAFALHVPALKPGGEVPPLVLVALAGGIAGLIAQSDRHALATHLLRWARSLATIAVALPLVATTYIALEAARTARLQYALDAVAAVGGVIALLLTAVCLLSWWRQGKDVLSPWEQSQKRKGSAERPENFDKGVKQYHYDKPAMRVDSAEGWLREFIWDDKSENQLLDAIRKQQNKKHL